MTAQAVEQENPLVEGLRLRRTPEPCVFVIFGASGDLTQRKLMPALYALAYRRLLPERFAVVGAARSAESDEEFRERMKEAVQNMLALRFANGIFEPIWNRQFIDHVQITVAESIGIEGRAAFYERAGAIRDIFQNHLLQLLAITAMEPPIDFTAESVRNEKVKVLRSLHTPGPKSVVRGQYGRGFIEGEEVVAYREEDGVAPDSMTETFVAAKLYVDNWRWADTPFYVRMGKRLARRETTIAIQFKRAPHPPILAPALTDAAILESWEGEDVRLADVESGLAALRAATAAEGRPPNLRTSVMTHLAWVPPEWREKAIDALAGMAERHPSRTILLDPQPDSGKNRIDANVTLECYPIPGSERDIC